MKSLLLGCLMMLTACSGTPVKTTLPHREQWELYSIQGLYSQINCPNQYAEIVQGPDGFTYFEGCWGKRDE